MHDLSLDMQDLIDILHRYGVEFLVCGGHAVAFHGYTRMTMDLDILVRPSPENAGRLKKALTEFGFGSAGIPWHAFESEGAVVSLGVQPNQVDLLTSISRQPTDEVFAHSIRGQMGGRDVGFVNREDLIRAKREANRPKDRLDIEELNRVETDRT